MPTISKFRLLTSYDVRLVKKGDCDCAVSYIYFYFYFYMWHRFTPIIHAMLKIFRLFQIQNIVGVQLCLGVVARALQRVVSTSQPTVEQL